MTAIFTFNLAILDGHHAGEPHKATTTADPKPSGNHIENNDNRGWFRLKVLELLGLRLITIH